MRQYTTEYMLELGKKVAIVTTDPWA